MPRIKRSAAAVTCPNKRTSPLIVFLPGISWEKRATSSSKLFSIVGFLFAHTYLGNCPSNLDSLPATWRLFQNSENRTSKSVNRHRKASKNQKNDRLQTTKPPMLLVSNFFFKIYLYFFLGRRSFTETKNEACFMLVTQGQSEKKHDDKW